MGYPPIVPAEWVIAGAGTPYSERYEDVYHSAAGGLEQARHVFIAGNGLPERWLGRDFTLLEIGFGLGLNFLATWQAWQQHPGRRLHYVALEKHPFRVADLEKLQGEWPELAPLAQRLRQHWPLPLPGLHRLAFDNVILTLGFGDALDLLPQLEGLADAVYLDGFKPEKNPAPWSEPALAQVRRLTAPGATLTTWTIAGELRRRLAAADFTVEKRPGFGFKRDMLFARRPGAVLPVPSFSARRIIVIGAGIAGAATARALAQRGHAVTVLEAANAPAQGASGNHVGVFRPLPALDDSRLARLLRAGFLFGQRQFPTLPNARLKWTGVLHLARDATHEATQRRIVEAHHFPDDFCRFVDQEEASALAHWPVPLGGWWFAQGGWINPPSLVQALLADLDVRYNTTVSTLDGLDADDIVIANGVGAPGLVRDPQLPIRPARGLVSLVAEPATPPLDIVVTRQGYVTPPLDGLRCAGATTQIDDLDPAPRLSDHEENLQRLDLALPGFGNALDPSRLDGRVSFRPMSPDRLPIVGPLSASEGRWIIDGFGARGLVFASICAELLASQICGEPLPLETELVSAVSPTRFASRAARSRPPLA